MQLHDHAELSAEAGHISTRQHLTLSVLWFALNFQGAALLPIVLPLQILLFVTPGAVGNAQQATFLGWLSALSAVLVLFVPAVAGALSDRTTGLWGRRRPYIAVGAVLLLAGASALAVPRGIGFLIGGLLLFQLGNTICTAGYQGLLPDLVPEAQHGEASGYIGLMTIVGNAGSLGLAAVLLGQVTASAADADIIRHGAALYYALTGFALAACALITVVGVHETPLDPDLFSSRHETPQGWRLRLAAAWIAPWRHTDFFWVFLTRASVMMGLTFFLTFIEYYFANVTDNPNFVQETAALSLLALVGGATTALLFGILSDRIGRVWLVCGSTVCMSLAALAFVIFPNTIPLWPLGLLFGLGYGTYTSVDWALAVDVLPSRSSAGKDMGLWSIASNLPSTLAPLMGGAAIALASLAGQTTLGYRMVFVFAVLFLIAGAVFIFKVPEQITARERQAASPRRRGRRGVAIGWRLALDTRGGQARGFLRFWPIWEHITLLIHPVMPIPGATANLFRIQWRRYAGAPIDLPDGTHVVPGDRIGEIHMNNHTIARVAAQVPSWQLMRLLRSDMRALARWATDPAFPADVRAFYGFTLLGSGAARLGFTLRSRRITLRTRLDRFFMMGLLALYNPSGRARLSEGTTYRTYPVEVWISRDELLRRYGAQPPTASSPSRS